MKKQIFAVATTLSYYALSAQMVFAQDSNVNLDPCAGDLSGKSGQVQSKLCGLAVNGTGKLIRNVIVAILIIAAVLSLFFLIYGGIRWILSGGDKTKVDEARKTIVAALIGLIITFLAYFILSIVLGLFGLNVSNLQLPTLTQ